MHELSVCLGLMRQIREVAAQHRASAVHRVRLSIGPLSGVEAELLRQAFPLVSEGTLAQGAELEIETGEVRVACQGCGEETAASPNRLLCGACGDWHTRVVAGDEMLLLSLELETPDAVGSA